MSDVQTLVQEAIDQLVEAESEKGLQVAVYRHGELVVDVVAGVADPETGRLVTSDSLFPCTSTAKGAAATVVHVLVERGLFGYDTPIVELWPEFGAHGKEKGTVRHALDHTLGVPGVPADTTPEDLPDWDKMCAMIADSELWWEPGTKTGYHALTFGYIVGEIVRRATGKPISQVLREEVAGPLGVENELFFGIPESELGRVVRLVGAPGTAEMLSSMPDDLPMFKTAPKSLQPTADFGNRDDLLTSDIPSMGTMSARGIARMYAALMDKVDGVRVVSPERLREISALETRDNDEIFGAPIPRALGYYIGRPGPSPQEDSAVFGMSGSGGTAAYADTSTGIAVAVTKNLVTFGEFTAVALVGDILAKTYPD